MERSIKIGFLHFTPVLSCESKNGGFGRNDDGAHKNHNWYKYYLKIIICFRKRSNSIERDIMREKVFRFILFSCLFLLILSVTNCRQKEPDRQQVVGAIIFGDYLVAVI